MVEYLKKHGLKKWDDEKASQILFGKSYEELNEDEKGELENEYWDFTGHMGN